MKLGRIIQAAMVVVAAFALVATASASGITITYETDLPAGGYSYITQFGGAGGLVLDSSDNLASLTFAPDGPTGASADVGMPGNINYGEFTLECDTCTDKGAPSAIGATFGGFTFDLYVLDSTDNAVDEFIGTSSGGTIYYDNSAIDITWTTAQIGPGPASSNGAGNFQTTFFTVGSTPIVAPNSGGGVTTVQGELGDEGSIPEPATMAMVGGLLIGLGALARKRRA
jgi:hypothetical protein